MPRAGPLRSRVDGSASNGLNVSVTKTSKRSAVAKHIKASTPEKRRRIEAAALALFTTQGFHGTNNREIAKRAGVSTAAIYTHYPSKEALFAGLVEQHRAYIAEWLRKTVGTLKEPLSKRDLRALGAAIGARLREDPQYFLLIFIDVVEFRGRHFRSSFHNVPQWFRLVLGPALARVKEEPGWCGQDPAFVMAAIYMYLVHYGLIERHMDGRQHLGVGDELAIKRIVDLLSGGLWPAAPDGTHGNGQDLSPTALAHRKLLDEAAQNRIDFLRLLSGRLWSNPPELPGGRSRDPAGRPPAKVPLMFLPEITRDRPDDTQLRIEAAALELFTTQGFHGTNIRDIADKAQVSQGAIYTYFPSKEAIFEDLVGTYRRCMTAFLGRVVLMLEEPFTREGLRLLAKSIRSMVYDDAQHWLLLFIDVLEFNNRHFADMYHDVPEQLRRVIRPVLQRTRKQPGWCGLDPAFALSVIYLLFFAYFVVERHMHGNQHLGVAEDEAIERLIDLLCHGIWRPSLAPVTFSQRARRAAVDPAPESPGFPAASK
jgi:AcrR family transcriptional regulator